MTLEPRHDPRGHREDRDDRREPEGIRGGFGADRGAFRDDGHGADRDRGRVGLEPNGRLHDERQPAPEWASGVGFAPRADAYQDDGRDLARDQASIRFGPAEIEAPGPSIDHGGSDNHVEHPERPWSLPGGGTPRTSEALAVRDDDIVTRPLPVILPGATSLPRPVPVEAPRGPFEPARPSQPSVRPASITGSVEPPTATFAAPVIPEPPGPRPMPEAAAAKLDQIKDLYLTAEAIGEDALDKHFDQVSQRQRELIREFFERSQQNGAQG
jgi:hypothetical protein